MRVIKAGSIQYGYRKCGTRVRVLSLKHLCMVTARMTEHEEIRRKEAAKTEQGKK